MSRTVKYAGVRIVDGDAGPALAAHIDIIRELCICCAAAAIYQLSKSHKLLRSADFIRGLLRACPGKLRCRISLTYLPVQTYAAASL